MYYEAVPWVDVGVPIYTHSAWLGGWCHYDRAEASLRLTPYLTGVDQSLALIQAGMAKYPLTQSASHTH